MRVMYSTPFMCVSAYLEYSGPAENLNSSWLQSNKQKFVSCSCYPFYPGLAWELCLIHTQAEEDLSVLPQFRKQEKNVVGCALALKALQWPRSVLWTHDWPEKVTAPKLPRGREVKSHPISGVTTGNIW